jgi:Ni,Fe-hydrogenase III large subunit
MSRRWPTAPGSAWSRAGAARSWSASSSMREGRLARVHPHDPSWQAWLALEFAVLRDIVPDFPLINKSFNLSYSGVDL